MWRVGGRGVQAAERMVAEPRTVSPSYSTAVWPAATPRAGVARDSAHPGPSGATSHSCTIPWARSCTEQRSGSGRGDDHTGTPVTTLVTSRAAAGPTVTVRDTGSTARTYRGRPSAAGPVQPRPRGCPPGDPAGPPGAPPTPPPPPTRPGRGP